MSRFIYPRNIPHGIPGACIQVDRALVCSVVFSVEDTGANDVLVVNSSHAYGAAKRGFI